MGYLTPDTSPTDTACRALFIPNDEAYLAIVRGALQELTFAYNWQKYGALTPEQAAANFLPMFDRFCFSEWGCRLVGEIIPYAGATPPNDKLMVCDGSSVASADYPDLYGVIGVTYGTIGAGYFNLPDLRGRSIAGVGTGTGIDPVALGQKYGEQSHSLTVSELATHSHTDTGHQHTVPNMVTSYAAEPGEVPVDTPLPFPQLSGNASANIQDTGDGAAFSIVGPRLGLTYLIVVK